MKSERKNYFAYAFDKLDDEAQILLETLTARLSEIHDTSPEKLTATGKKAKNILQPNRKQDN
ncbi:MAG: hypothetical protein LBK66_04615 [Spirochaetaceae bacterium]|nr:hypothetical protein [Spirochaetaceae bacterium]